MATRAKESSGVGKEKKVPSSSSQITTSTKKTAKPCTTDKADSTSSPDKQIPNYLKPTISSRLESHSLKLRKGDSPQRPTLNRRRSFDKPPSPSNLNKHSQSFSSRLHKALVSPGPRERTAPPLRSSSFSVRSSIPSIPNSERPSKTPRDGKTQPLSAKSVKKSSTSASTAKKVPTEASANSRKAPKSAEIVEALDVETPKSVETTEALDVETPKSVETTEALDFETPKSVETTEALDVETPKSVETTEALDVETPKTAATTEALDVEIPKTAATTETLDVEIPRTAATTEVLDVEIPKTAATAEALDVETEKQAKETTNQKVEVVVMEDDKQQIENVSDQIPPDVEIEHEHEQDHVPEECKPDEPHIQADDDKVIPTASSTEDKEAKPVIEVDEVEEAKEETHEEKTEDEHEEEDKKNQDENNNGGDPEEQVVDVKENEEEGGGVTEEHESDNNKEEKTLEDKEGVEGGTSEGLKLKEGEDDDHVESEVGDVKTEPTPQKQQAGEREGKKEPQASNDVIEETASKLLETRKNKVRALAGAFQTVIDHQSK